MKRILALLLSLACLLSVPASADIPDISGLSFDELVTLRNEALLTMWKAEEWKEVSVYSNCSIDDANKKLLDILSQKENKL